jgi:hypothetical protein
MSGTVERILRGSGVVVATAGAGVVAVVGAAAVGWVAVVVAVFGGGSFEQATRRAARRSFRIGAA